MGKGGLFIAPPPDQSALLGRRALLPKMEQVIGVSVADCQTLTLPKRGELHLIQLSALFEVTEDYLSLVLHQLTAEMYLNKLLKRSSKPCIFTAGDN